MHAGGLEVRSDGLLAPGGLARRAGAPNVNLLRSLTAAVDGAVGQAAENGRRPCQSADAVAAQRRLLPRRGWKLRAAWQIVGHLRLVCALHGNVRVNSRRIPPRPEKPDKRLGEQEQRPLLLPCYRHLRRRQGRKWAVQPRHSFVPLAIINLP